MSSVVIQHDTSIDAHAPASMPGPDSPLAAADASPQWPGEEPRPGSGHWVSTAVATPRPVLTFPTGGHECRQYRAVCGFYECSHGHVLRIRAAVRGGQP